MIERIPGINGLLDNPLGDDVVLTGDAPIPTTLLAGTSRNDVADCKIGHNGASSSSVRDFEFYDDVSIEYSPLRVRNLQIERMMQADRVGLTAVAAPVRDLSADLKKSSLRMPTLVSRPYRCTFMGTLMEQLPSSILRPLHALCQADPRLCPGHRLRIHLLYNYADRRQQHPY